MAAGPRVEGCLGHHRAAPISCPWCGPPRLHDGTWKRDFRFGVRLRARHSQPVAERGDRRRDHPRVGWGDRPADGVRQVREADAMELAWLDEHAQTLA